MKKILLLGSGELGKEFVISAQRKCHCQCNRTVRFRRIDPDPSNAPR